ncbi:MAG: hypothetical protein ACK452_06175, partial [Bacteroidota bacterium]
MVDIDKNRLYKIEYPAIPSAGVYFFNTDSGIRYEVRFGRRQDNILHSTIVFGVVNEEFNGEEYVTTNRGEVYRVMLTISEIVKSFMKEHPKMMIYEFHAVDSDEEENPGSGKSNARMFLYRRYLPIIFDGSSWTFHIDGNKA